MSEVRRYDVGMSIEALASAWARTENAAHGSMVVVSNEISGRLRGGTPWTAAATDALMIGMVIRPSLPPMKEPLLWLAASVGTAEALEETTGNEHSIIWPDQVVAGTSPTAATVSFTNVLVQLGPGRIEHGVFAIRVVLPKRTIDRDELTQTLRDRLEAACRLLDDDQHMMIDAFTERCSIINRQVRAELLPRGTTRGRAAAIDPDGFLVLESPTAMLERIAPAALRSLKPAE